jgi:hypothetical protein
MSRLNMDFDKDEDETIAALKKEYGMKQTTELMRFLLRHTYKELANSNLGSTSSSG